jgi:hypothetical protein
MPRITLRRAFSSPARRGPAGSSSTNFDAFIEGRRGAIWPRLIHDTVSLNRAPSYRFYRDC